MADRSLRPLILALAPGHEAQLDALKALRIKLAHELAAVVIQLRHFDTQTTAVLQTVLINSGSFGVAAFGRYENKPIIRNN